MLCVCCTACAGQMSLGDGSAVLGAKKADISIPDEITMEFFGVNLLGVNRPIWEKYIFSLNELGEGDYIYTTFPIGDYEVTHSYLNYENKGNFSSYVTYNNDRDRTTQILFDENGNLTKIDIRADMGEEFSTSFLNIGDNVKEYFESCKKGSWNKFLDDKEIVAENGWYVRHYTTAISDYTYDVLEVCNRNISVSYFIKDEVVDWISLYVYGEITLNDDISTESSIYYLEAFDFYINGTDVATMSVNEWLELFNIEQGRFLIGDFEDDCFTVLKGTKLGAIYNYYEDECYKEIIATIYPITEEGEPLCQGYKYDSSKGTSIIEVIVNKEGYLNVNLHIEGECPGITSNNIMPGDNVKDFLNSYEDGLYEEIVSLPNNSEEYRIGPYAFQYDDSDSEHIGNIITIKKDDEKSSLPISIFFKDEIVTKVYRSYQGTISNYADDPVMK